MRRRREDGGGEHDKACLRHLWSIIWEHKNQKNIFFCENSYKNLKS